MKMPNLRFVVLACVLSGGSALFTRPVVAQTNALETSAAKPVRAAANSAEAPPEASAEAKDASATPAARPADGAITISATKPAPATNAPARNIRFQFEGITYMDALERFAQMAGKPLVTDTNILGTLTFKDPNPYTYGEALDMLNVMLAMKGTMLMESGHYLQLVQVKQLPQMPLKIMRGVDQSGDMRPGEVVTVVLPVKNVDSKEIADAITAMLSNAGSVAPLPKGRGLIVTDKLGSIQRIRYLLSQIDTEATVDRQMKTYTLIHASGAIVCDLLNRTFGIATAPKRTQYNPNSKQLEVLPPDPNDYVTAVYDDASRTLVLFGPNERMALAEELVNRFEQQGGGGGDVRIYYPSSIKADELASLIRQAIPGVAAAGENATGAATKARLIPDVVQNRLIVSAPIPGQLEDIERLITRLDKGVQGAKSSDGSVPVRSTTIQLTRVFRPRAAEATNIAQILTTALTRKQPNGQVTTTASVSSEPGSQSVVVSGSPGDIQIASDIVAQLETGTSQPTPLQTKFIELGSIAEARRLQPIVEQLYRNQVSDGFLGQGAHAKILADTESGRLIVTASEEHVTKIEALVKQLRGDRGSKAQERRLQIITLKATKVDTLLKSITDLTGERMNEKRFQDLPKPLILADAPNNRLLVTATDDQLKEIEQVISTLDVAPEKTHREMTLIPVTSKSASELIALATQLMTQMGDDQTNPHLAPKLVPDASGKQIIVVATTKDTQRISELVKQLDGAAATTSARQFRGVDLFSRTTTEFTPLVQQLYQEQLKGALEPAGGPAALIADPKNNRIMVSGTEKEIARVESIIRQLDPSESKAAKEETRVIRLKSALAQDLAGLVEKSLGSQSTKVKVLTDARSNSLVVSGEASAVDAAAKIINDLDTRSDSSPKEMRIFELKQGEAASTSTLVNSLFAELMKDKRGPDYVVQTKIVPDAAANRLIATGPKEELSLINDLVERLDQAPEATGGAKVFKLVNADAVQVVGVLSNVMLKFDARNQPIRRVSLSADRESNSIIVTGQRNDLRDAESIIQRIDNEGFDPSTGGGGGGFATSRARELKIIEVKSEDPDALAALAMKVFTAQNTGRTITNLVSITVEPNGKRLIVLAPPNVLPQVETAITTLDAKSDSGVRELQNIDLKNASATELLPAVQRIYTEQSQGKTGRPATIYPDASGTRFTVYGTKEQAAQIRQVVETLESQQRAPRETKIFDLGRLAEAQRVLPLAQQLYRDQVSSNPQAGPADAQMVSDGKTGRVIVSARTNQMAQLEQIITRLQLSSTTNLIARETKALDVGNAAEVQRLLPLVQQLYQDQWKDRNETDPADAQIVADARGGRLVVTGKPEHVKAIEAIVKEFGKSETAKPRTGDTRDTRIFDLTTASAPELATTVRTLYLEQAKARFGTLAPDTLIVPDAGGNRLIVVGETEELDEIDGIIKKLDKVSAQSSSARIFKLKSADPAKVAEIMTAAMVRYDGYGRPQKRCSVSVDAKSRMLIVTGDPKELQSASVIIEQLDQSLGERPERTMKVVTLRQGRVTELIAKARQLYNDALTTQPVLGTTELLMVEDATSNQIVLAGTEAQLNLFNQIVTELQAAATTTGPRETKTIEIGFVEEMTRLLPLVQQLYQERVKNRDASDAADAQIISDTKNARFIVTARTNHLAMIEDLVKELRTTDLAQPRDTRIFELTAANAVEFSTTVRSLYLDNAKNRAGAQPQDTLILPDVSANRLIVTGTSNELSAVEDLIKKLDKVSAQSGTVRVFKLKSADPAKVLEILLNTLTSYDSYGRQRRRVGVTLDAKTRTIIVAGDPKELQSLQNAALIIEQLDTALGQQAERKIKVLSLKQAKVADLSSKVRQLYNDQLAGRPELGTTEVLILEDAPSNQLILAGSEAQLGLIEQITTQLETSSLVTEPRETKVYELTSTTAPELATTVKSLYQEAIKAHATSPASQALIMPDVNANRLIVSASTNDLAVIDDIIQKIDKTEAQSGRTRVFRLKQAEAEQVGTILSTALVQMTPAGRQVPRV
jgi:type II secretory pathway component GspD/PulD (secretin)